jgi:hypothetical protein
VLRKVKTDFVLVGRDIRRLRAKVHAKALSFNQLAVNKVNIADKKKVRFI